MAPQNTQTTDPIFDSLEGHKSEIQRIHIQIYGKSLDSKALNYWANCIANNIKTIADIQELFMMSSDYRKRLAMLFRNMWTRYITHYGNTEDDISMENMDKYVDGFVERYAGKEVNDDIIFAYITSMPEFYQKYTSIISNIYMTYKKDTCPAKVLDFYIQKFKSDQNYSLDGLVFDIQNDLHASITKKDEEQSQRKRLEDMYIRFGKEFQESTGRPPSIETDLPQTVDVKLPDNKLDFESIDIFERTFQRPIYVQEYFKYIHGSNTLTDSDAIYIYNEHVENYNRLREIFLMYSGKEIDEYTGYIHKYLQEVETPYFFENIINTIVVSSEYEHGMKKELFDVYKKMYDDELDTADIDYLFEIVKKQKLGISDDKLVSVITTFKNETDNIIHHIFQQYLAVLEREPDMYEIEQFVSYYRNELENVDNPINNVDKSLESKLMKNLEFHDVLKKRIKQTNKDMLPSVVFDILQRVLSNINSMTISDVDNVIEKYLKSHTLN